MSEMYRRTLTAEEKEKFAYEIALGYYTPDELRHAFKLLPQAFGLYIASDEIKQLVIVQRRAIDESDQAMRIHARKAARVAIEQNVKLVSDPDAPARTRMAASKELREFASVVDKAALATDGEGPIIIRTNLDLKAARGVYTISREEVDAQVAENERAAAEAEVADDFADLLGGV